MWSSHSATVTAFATTIGFREGFGGPLFANTLVLSIIVMYDATVVRLQARRQAERIPESPPNCKTYLLERRLQRRQRHCFFLPPPPPLASPLQFGYHQFQVFILLSLKMNTPSKQNKSTADGKGETSGGDSTLFEFESDVVDLPLAKGNDDQYLVKRNIGEGGEQGKKKKKKKRSEERKNDEHNQFKGDECEEGDDGKKMKKKRKLIEGEALEDCDDFRSNEGEDGEGGRKLKKKKKVSEESKQNDYKEVKSNDWEEDEQGNKMKKKKKLIEGNTPNVSNDFSNNEGEDGDQAKKLKKKKKKRSEESEPMDYNKDKSNECEDGHLEKKMKKKKKLIEGNTLNVSNDFSNNEGEDGDQAKKLKKKKKKRSEESEPKDYNKDKSNECEDGHHEKIVKKKKKLIEGGRLEECNDDVISNGDVDQGKTKKKKNKPSHKRKSKNDNGFNNNQGEVNDQGEEMKKKKEAKAVTNESPNSASKPKRVTFSDHVEEFCCDGLVRGKRYTPEEDEKIKAAVHDYISSHGLGDDGIDMVLRPRSQPLVRGCWKIIAQALPHRPAYSVYNRGHVLFENNVEFEWTPEEREFVRKHYEQHGPDSRAVADALGKSQNQVKHLWRRLKYTELKQGAWSQDEYQTLFNLVNQDLRIRAEEPYRKSQHGMLRDNISWEAISHKLKTRDSAICCLKWYNQLVSPMTANGEWLDSDDFRLIGALYALDACCMEEVDWDNLIEHRSGDVCRRRWDQMVQHIGERAGRSFIEQVEILAKRFCPDLMEAREAFENKPVVC